MTPPKTHGTLLVTDPEAAVTAIIDVLSVCATAKVRWLAHLQLERDPDEAPGPYAARRKELPREIP